MATYNVVDERLLDLEQLLVHLCNLLLSARPQEGALGHGPHAIGEKGATPFVNLLMKSVICLMSLSALPMFL